MAARQAFCNRLSLLVTAGLDRWSSKQNSAYRLTQKIINRAGVKPVFYFPFLKSGIKGNLVAYIYRFDLHLQGE